jgi:hypothetical protein
VTSFVILALLFAQQATPPEKCTLSGTVVDSVTGMPLGKVDMVAENPANRDGDAATTSDAKGNFVMIDVEPGQYRISARRNGYLDTYYGAKRPSAPGSTLNLTSGQKLNDLRIKLTPFGVIAGTVRDSDGEPMADVEVNLQTVSYSAGRHRVQGYDSTGTDDLGQYRIANLEPGKYYVSAVAHSRGGYTKPTVDHSAKSSNPPEVPIATFYPGTADPAAARPIEIAAGARVTGVDIALIRSRVHKVAIHIDAPGGLEVSASLSYSAEGFGDVGIPRTVNNSGDAEITGVPPGSYVMRVSAREPAKPFDGTIELYGHPECSVSVPLSVGQNDVTGVRMAAAGCAEVTGHITFEGEDKPKTDGNNVYLDFGEGPNVIVKADGSFRALLSPGHHTVDLVRTHDGVYIKAIHFSNQEALRDGFMASGSEHVELEVVLASDGGRVEGVVSDAGDKPVLGATVVLIPNDAALRTRFDYTRDAVTDQVGHFELKGVAPGEYKLFAWDDIEDSNWLDPDVLRSVEAKGEAVTVKPKEPATANLHVIP